MPRLSVGRKLALLTGVALAVAGLLAALGLSVLSSTGDAAARRGTLFQAQSALNLLDTRNAELEASGYRSLLQEDSDARSPELAQDAEEVAQALEGLLALPLPAAVQAEVEKSRAHVESYAAYVGTVAARAGEDREDALRAVPEVAERNADVHERLEQVHTAVGAATARAVEQGDAAQDRARLSLLGLLAGALVALVVLSRVITRSVTRPLGRAVEVLDAVSGGDLTQRIGVSGNDEVGRMSSALDATVERFRGAVAAMSASSTQVEAASSRLSGSATELDSAAGLAAEETSRAAGAAEQVAASIASLAAGAEEMTASIGEIARGASDAAAVAGEAVGIVQATNDAIVQLGESSAEIGDVIGSISAIAQQTNLLALNATIEAARAGESGKGFAVVAGEVKELAQETARATADITARITAIQADTGAAVEAIARITEIVGRISDTQQTIASAVEEQTATSGEIGRAVSQASAGTTEVVGTLGVLRGSTETTTHGASSTSAAARELADVSAHLHALVAQFRC